MNTYIHTYIHTYIYIYHTHTHTYIYRNAQISTHMHACRTPNSTPTKAYTASKTRPNPQHQPQNTILKGEDQACLQVYFYPPMCLAFPEIALGCRKLGRLVWTLLQKHRAYIAVLILDIMTEGTHRSRLKMGLW